jgi:hypothetical protein
MRGSAEPSLLGVPRLRGLLALNVGEEEAGCPLVLDSSLLSHLLFVALATEAFGVPQFPQMYQARKRITSHSGG